MSAMLGRGRSLNTAIAIVGLVLFLVIPNFTNTFQTFEFAQVAVFTTAIIGMNILTGYSGQISLGNGFFMAIGSYTTALMVHNLHVPYVVTIPIGALLSFVIGVLVGIPALRLRGIYLALATFALALCATPILNNYDSFTGGHAGTSIPTVKPPFGLPLSNEQWLYFFDFVVLAIMFVPAWLLTGSRTGRAWTAIRDSETAAVANGISLAYYKTLAFGLSALYAGVAGSLLVINISYVNPDSYNLQLSLTLLIGLVLGGLAYLWGPLLGGLLVVWLPYVAEQAFKGKPDVAFGILLVVVVFAAPNGAAGLIHRGIRRLSGGRLGSSQAAAVMEHPTESETITT